MEVNDKKLKEIIGKYQSLKRKLPRIVGQVAVNFTKDNFRRQGFLDGGRVNKWKKRRDTGDKKSRSILVQSAKLKRSIRIVRSTQDEVLIGSDVPYAQIHNEGGVQQITKKQRDFFYAKWKETGQEFWRNMFLASEIRIPRRKFMGDSTDLQRDMTRKINLELLKIFK